MLEISPVAYPIRQSPTPLGEMRSVKGKTPFQRFDSGLSGIATGGRIVALIPAPFLFRAWIIKRACERILSAIIPVENFLLWLAWQKAV